MDAGIVTTLIGTAAVGAALATLIVRLIRGVEKQIDTLRDDVRELRREQTSLRDRVAQLSDRVSRIEALLEGLREAITGRTAAAGQDVRMDAGIVTTLIGTAAVGAALATLIVRLIRGVEKQIDTLRDDVRELRREQAGLRDRVSRIEGLLEGLREAITGRAVAAD